MSKQKPPAKKSGTKAAAKTAGPVRAGHSKAVAPNSTNRNILFALAAVLLLTLVSYYPIMNNGFTNWDDDNYIVQNSMLPNDKPADYFTKDKFVMGNYHPLTMLTYAMDYKAAIDSKTGKLNPQRFHLDNLVLHLFNTALVFFLIFLLAGHWQGAAIAAALFGIHPMHVESVAWMSERKDVLYAFFYIAALIVYIYYIRNKKPVMYAGVLILFILSLLSKGQAVTLPISMLLVDYFCNRKFTSKTIIEKIPFFILSIVFSVIAVLAQHSSSAINTKLGFGFYTFLFAFYGLGSYLFRFLLPVQLSCFYPYPVTHSGSLMMVVYIAPILVIGVLALVYYKFRKNKSIVFGSLFFLFNIGPLLQLLPIGSFVTSDRYTYIPYIGLCFIVAQVVMYFYGYIIKDGYRPRKAVATPSPFKYAILTVVILVIGVYAYASNERSKVWKDSITLFTSAVQNYPDAGRAYNNLGYAYYTQSKNFSALGKPDSAKKSMEIAVNDFKKGCEIIPDYYEALCNLGQSYTALGKNDSAIYYLTQAIRIQPGASTAWVSRGAAYRIEGKPDSALADINHAIALSPGDPAIYNSRANVYFSKGMFRDAIKNYNLSMSMDPYSGMQYNSLGHCYNQLKIYDSAIYYYNKSLALNPGLLDTYVKRGLAYAGKADYNDAIKDYSTAINMNNADAEAYALRSVAFMGMNDKKSALADALQAKQLGYPVQQGYLAQLQK